MTRTIPSHPPRPLFKTALSAALATALLFATSGCVHTMQVRNLDEFRLGAHSGSRHSLRLTAPDSGPSQPYGEMIRDALAKHASVADVMRNGDPQYDRKPDVDVRADIVVKYSGSGANFPITFPGFLVFAHAWNGFIYKADIQTNLSVTSTADGQVRTRALKTKYDMRHCDFGRGFWASSGWFLPGWGATSLIAGAFMVSYDKDATPEFCAAVHDAYGSYVANNIAEMMTELEATSRPVAAAPAPAAPAAAAPKEAAKKKTAPAKLSKPAPAASAPAPAAVATPPAATAPVVSPPAAETDEQYNDRIRREQAAAPQ